MSDFMRHNATEVSFNSSDSWVILSPIELSIKRKIEAVGVPLKDWDINIYRGVLTGYNEAFIISTDKRNEILSKCKDEDERKRTEELIRPILRGRDIKRYGYEWAGLWLIWIPWHFPLHLDNSIKGASIEAEEAFMSHYSAVYDHLLQFKKELSARNKAETGIRYEWYALQRWGANYWDDFSKPKIIYPNMTKFMPFYYDKDCFMTNQKCFIITGKYTAFLTAFFNSSLFKYCFRDAFPELQGGTRELSKIFFDKIPVPQVDEDTDNLFQELITELQAKPSKALIIHIDNLIFNLYNLSSEERKAIGFIEIQ